MEQTTEQQWEPGRWWRAVTVRDGSLWAESSDEQEVRAAATEGPEPMKVQRHMRRVEEKWQDVE